MKKYFLCSIFLLLLVPLCSCSFSIECTNNKTIHRIPNITCSFGCCKTQFDEKICCDNVNITLSSGVIACIVIGSFISLLILLLIIFLISKQFVFKDSKLFFKYPSSIDDKLPSQYAGNYYQKRNSISSSVGKNIIVYSPSDLIDNKLFKPCNLYTGYEGIKIQMARNISPTISSTSSSTINNDKIQYKSFATILKAHK